MSASWNPLSWLSSSSTSSNQQPTDDVGDETDSTAPSTSHALAFADMPLDRVVAHIVSDTIHTSLYSTTRTMLQAMPDLEPSQISIVLSDERGGLLIDGVHRGCHVVWLSKADDMYFDGDFFVEHDANGAPLEPYYHYPSSKEVVKYWPSTHAWWLYSTDDNGVETLEQVSFMHTGSDSGDYKQYDFDQNGNVIYHEERSGGKMLVQVEFDADGCVTYVHHFGCDEDETEDEFRVGETQAPTLEALTK